jgi:hypothetical protein
VIDTIRYILQLCGTSQFNAKGFGGGVFQDVKLMHENNLNAELSIGYQ